MEEATLFSAEDTTKGTVQISLFNITALQREGESSTSSQAQPLGIKARHLSQECGDAFARCELVRVEVTAADKEEEPFRYAIVFLPLHKGLALVKIKHGSDQRYSTELKILDTGDFACSPSAVFKIRGGFFMVCSNKTTNYVSLVEIRLNTTSFQESQSSLPFIQQTIPVSVGNITDTSNFLHMELDQDHQYIVFALGTAFYSFNIYNHDMSRLEDLPAQLCTGGVHKLIPTRSNNYQFLAFCTDNLFLYDLGEEGWISHNTFAAIGVPYLCPHPVIDFSVFPDYIQYSITTGTGGNGGLLSQTVNIQGDASQNGACFGNTTHQYFAFSDPVIGVSIMNLNTSANLIPFTCQDDACTPLLVMDNRYLVVRDLAGRLVLVVDLYTGGPLTLRTTASLTTILPLQHAVYTPEGDVVPEKKVSHNSHSINMVGLIGGTVTAGCVIFIVLVVTAVILVCVIHKRLKRRDYQLPTSVEESRRVEGMCSSE